MTTPTTSACPFHADRAGVPLAPAAQPALQPALQPAGSWPPGPPSGITGWGLLRRMSKDLLATLADWRATYGNLVHLRIWPEHQVIVTDPHLVRELLLTHHDKLVRWERGIAVMSQLHGNSVLTAEGPAWQSRRRALQPSFSPKGVQAYVPPIAAATHTALAQWPAEDGDWPIESAMTSLAMDVIMGFLFSSPADADARRIEEAVHCMSVAANAEFYWPASAPDWVPWKRAKRAAKQVLDQLIKRQIDTRLALDRAAWPDDLLSKLLALHAADPAAWPRQAVRDECMTAFLAGHETTAATLTWWAWCMAANPAAQQTAQQEVAAVLQGRTPTAADLPALAGITRTLQETLRLYPAAPVLLSRRAVAPLTLGGWQLPAGTMFMVPVQLMQQDPAWFADPLAFQPERFAAATDNAPRGAYMPLGAGPRVCLGQHLAMTEMTVIATMLLQRFELAVPDGMVIPEPALHVTLRPTHSLHLKLRQRQRF
ncbi:putative bifunctional P-450/NADPH-P450 reductase 2 [Duganella phyllosphaerae]|uniref:Putative bifunctional P-450/NADPH-P450 reductase 2 n=2 Tax=Duganella phyllosphaerae TaxID=762836 RepID=A0A1E7WFA7_9BURK|nr:putative bifunctional P-450/NADPH-P450 reductase 2 [Duganella phyllosphaerae]